MERPPKVFISYSQDNQEHSDWVLNFATKLRCLGIDVTCDIWDLNIGDDLLFFMNNGLNNVNIVICICSEKYEKKPIIWLVVQVMKQCFYHHPS